MNIEKLHNELIDYLKEGKFAEGIESFYAEDVIASEVGSAPKQGRDQMAADEREFLKKVTAYHGIEVLDQLIKDNGDGSGVVFYEAVMKWNQSDKGAVIVSQVVKEEWKNSKIAQIKFYGNFEG